MTYFRFYIAKPSHMNKQISNHNSNASGLTTSQAKPSEVTIAILKQFARTINTMVKPKTEGSIFNSN